MTERELGPQGEQALEQVLGYLNFSAGAPDPQFLANLNLLYGLAGDEDSLTPAWLHVVTRLGGKLASLRTTSAAFADAEQVTAVLQLLVEHVVPGYLEFHRDLLFHQTDGSLVGPFFMGRICEAVLRQGGPWQEAERITRGAISELNDYLGHRPVATLESQKIEPYAHEWVRPVPIYVRGAGVAVGAHQEVVEAALKLLADTEDDLLRAACFDLKLLDELAVDPRAYDFEHPVNKRPNYHFGQWDPHCIDGQGRYRRYVVQQVTLDTLMKRLVDGEGIPHDELVVEAAAVLVGTILMAAGVSGTGPDTHDSTASSS